MAGKTGSELITAVTGNIGNRSTGKIGGQTVSDAILGHINDSMMSIAKEFDPSELEKLYSVDVTTSTNQYSLPSSEGDIKNMVIVRLLSDGESNHSVLTRLSQQRWLSFFTDNTSAVAGRPSEYYVHGGVINLYPYPEDDYTLQIFCNVWPTYFTTDMISQAHPLGAKWDDFIVKDVTYRTQHSLQQIKDAELWHRLAREELKKVKGVLRKEPDLLWDSSMSGEDLVSMSGMRSSRLRPLVGDVRIVPSV